MKSVLFIADSKITFTEASPSRFIYIAKTLQKKGVKVQLIGRKGEKIKDLNITQVSGGKTISRIKLVLLSYRNIFNFSHIITRGGLISFFLSPLKLFHKRLILEFHASLSKQIDAYYEKTVYNKFKVYLYRFLEWATLKFSNLIVCNSLESMNMLNERLKKKAILLEDGVDINESKAILQNKKYQNEISKKYGITSETPHIGFLGNWEMWMDLETLFDAVQFTEAQLIVVGTGKNIEHYQEKYKNITFTGRLPRCEAMTIMCLCDMLVAPYETDYVLPSRKIRDYLSLGKPIITPNIQCETFLKPNENVIMYKPKDPKDLAEKLNALLKNKSLLSLLGENNFKIASNFSWNNVVKNSGLMEYLR